MKTAPASTSLAASARRTEHRRVKRLVVPVFLLLGSATLLCDAARADPVRKCHVEGRVVFQSAPCPPEAGATTVAARVAPAAAPALASDADGGLPKKKTLADLLRERDGGDRPRAQAQDAQGDGAKVLRARMGAV